MTALKPCKCGASVQVKRQSKLGHGRVWFYRVICPQWTRLTSNMGMHTISTSWRDTPEEAAAEWNDNGKD